MSKSSSTLTINFSLRQNKAIERSIAFEALTNLSGFLGDELVYVGLGSLWFQDFQLAHRMLQIKSMVSIEANADIFKRQAFNQPYRTIELYHGSTTEVIPILLEDDEYSRRPWVAWLDYDQKLSTQRVNELADLVRELPEGSAILTTFNAGPASYTRDPAELPGILFELFDDVIDTAGLEENPPTTADFTRLLIQGLTDFLVSTAVQAARPGGFVPILKISYRDGAHMATVGGILPTAQAGTSVRELVESSNWFGFLSESIETQPLTRKEIQALTQLLPFDDDLSIEDVEQLGFELPESQVRFFQRHYRRYPVYAEIV